MRPTPLHASRARRIWLQAQRLDVAEPFGSGPLASQAAIAHLGYVQIDTIHVIERCHHHILFNRIPAYRRADLAHLQSRAKTVFEVWTHALAYAPVDDYPYYAAMMKRHRRAPLPYFKDVSAADYRRVLGLVRDQGPLTIRDIEDEILIEKTELWASRKPSKKALELALWNGILTVSRRDGMVKTYDLAHRHFGWDSPPQPVSETRRLDHLIDVALRTQGIVSLDSIRHTRRNLIGPLKARIESRVRRSALVPVALEGAEQVGHWAHPSALEAMAAEPDLVHILSPFDPLVRLRQRCGWFFGYQHLFEAYTPKAKRRFGYFTLPVLVGDRFVALLDLKTDRDAQRVLIQAWTWLVDESPEHRRALEDALGRFERFQLGRDETDFASPLTPRP